jgi:NAD(P) transhydrogenase subunit alpha
MKIGIPREVHSGERRVAASAEAAEKMIKLGFSLIVESGAGNSSDISDEDYRKAGCEIVAGPKEVWSIADIVLKVRAPEQHPALGIHEAELLRPDQMLISFIWPGQNPDLVKSLAARKATVLGMDCVPRISRAQKLDALSSMANIAGYRAVIEAAHHFGRFFTGQITAAGKVPPAKVLVIGAGVAGLSAIGTAGGLGAVVRGFDTRLEVKDQVESMGGEFLELDFKEDGSTSGGYAKVMSPEFIKAEMDLFAKQAKEVDIIITTALIPGKPAPKLVTAEMVKSMKAGSVIVDMAAEQGGNCELTEPGKVVVKHGVNIIGYTDLPSRLAKQSSQLYANNLLRLLEELCPKKDGVIALNLQDEVLRGTTVIEKGNVLWPPPPVKVSAAPAARKAEAPVTAKAAGKGGHGGGSKGPGSIVPIVVTAAALIAIGAFAPASLMAQLTVFVLACFVGYMVVWNVKASLHTPLMSVTNAISGIIAVGAVLQISSDNTVVKTLAAIAVLVATINIAGGFLVTQRMLKMFRK